MANSTGSAAAGPLAVSKVNPRYFTLATDNASDGQAACLTGSRTWNMQSEPGSMPLAIDYRAYLRFLKGPAHNFIRQWRWEHFAQSVESLTPQP